MTDASAASVVMTRADGSTADSNRCKVGISMKVERDRTEVTLEDLSRTCLPTTVDATIEPNILLNDGESLVEDLSEVKVGFTQD